MIADDVSAKHSATPAKQNHNGQASPRSALSAARRCRRKTKKTNKERSACERLDGAYLKPSLKALFPSNPNGRVLGQIQTRLGM